MQLIIKSQYYFIIGHQNGYMQLMTYMKLVSLLTLKDYTEGCDSNMNLDAEDWLEVSEFPCKSRQATIYVILFLSLL